MLAEIRNVVVVPVPGDCRQMNESECLLRTSPIFTLDEQARLHTQERADACTRVLLGLTRMVEAGPLLSSAQEVSLWSRSCRQTEDKDGN